MDGGVAEVDILLFEGCECVVAHAVEDELLPGFLCAEVLGIAELRFLVVCDNLFTLSSADTCFECRRSVRSWVVWCLVCPCVVRNDHPVLILWDDACEVAVASALVVVVGRQDCEYPPDFIFEIVDGFRCDGTCDPRDGALLGGKDLIGSILCFARHAAFAFGGLLLAVA